MEKQILNEISTRNNSIYRTSSIKTIASQKTDFIDYKSNKQTVEGSETVFEYLDLLGLSKDPNLIILSSVHHYYYDIDELKEVKILINLKRLNHIDRINDFLQSIFHVLPEKSSFIGCFEEHNKPRGYMASYNSIPQKPGINQDHLENGIVSRRPIVNILFNFIDSRTNAFLSRKSVSSLMEHHGFKVLNFSALNGLTYFHARNIK